VFVAIQSRWRDFARKLRRESVRQKRSRDAVLLLRRKREV
jgi:hypothetical protein